MILEELNIDPDIWGPHLWHSMEAIACTLDNSNKKEICFFFKSLKSVIPCEKCREHYNIFWDSHPIEEYTHNNLTLLLWLYKLKSEIKKRQEKEVVPFMDWIKFLVERYDVPELYFYLQKNDEYRQIMKSLNVTESPFFGKYKLSEYEL